MSAGNSMASSTLAPKYSGSHKGQKLIISIFIMGTLGYSLLNHKFGEIVVASIADAYIQVTSFVAATLFLFYGIERLFKINIARKLANSGNLQVFFACLTWRFTGVWGRYNCYYPLCFGFPKFWFSACHSNSNNGRCSFFTHS